MENLTSEFAISLVGVFPRRMESGDTPVFLVNALLLPVIAFLFVRLHTALFRPHPATMLGPFARNLFVRIVLALRRRVVALRVVLPVVAFRLVHGFPPPAHVHHATVFPIPALDQFFWILLVARNRGLLEGAGDVVQAVPVIAVLRVYHNPPAWSPHFTTLATINAIDQIVLGVGHVRGKVFLFQMRPELTPEI